MAVIPTTINLGTTVNVLTLAAGSPGGLNPASTIDPANDYLSIYTASATATQGINRNTLLNLTSQPVGISDTQTLSNKTIGDTNTILAKDGAFTLQNSSDITKQGVFSLAGLTTGNTRTYTLPNYNATLASLSGTETLTAKTLTSPTINSPTITNATISADSISGYTTNNTGSIYGVAVTAGSISGMSITSATITGTQLTNSYKINRNNNGSNIAEPSSKIQTGWVAGQPGVNASITIAITFPVAYTNVPIVVATFGGDTSGVTSTLGSGGGNVKQAISEAFSITTTGFSLVVLTRDNTDWATNNTVYAQWIAVGI